MQKRTFVRIMFDSIFNNPVVRAVQTLVNFCNNSSFYNKSELKFLKNMPLNYKEKEPVYKNKFIFDASLAAGVNSKSYVNNCNK